MRSVTKIITIAIFANITAFAAQGFDLPSAQKKATAKIDKDIKVLESAKECVNKASNEAEFSACRQKAKIDLQAAKNSK